MATIETEKDISSRTKAQTNTVTSPIAEQNGRNLLFKNNPNRSKFRKSHTCGSLFANCACSPPLSNLAEQKRTLLQTYSHPDTPFVFTNENRIPSETSPTTGTEYKNGKKNFFSTKDGRIKISYPKRLSTPNIGNYALLDVHPEIVLKVSKDISRITSQNDDFQSTLNNRRTQSESVCSNDSQSSTSLNCFSTKGESGEEDQEQESGIEIIDIENNTAGTSPPDKIEIKPTTPLTPASPPSPLINNLSSCTTTTSHALNDNSEEYNENDIDYKISSANNLEYLKNIAIGYQQETINNRVESAAKFFQESGILGPMIGNGSALARKTSKIQETTIAIEQVSYII